MSSLLPSLARLLEPIHRFMVEDDSQLGRPLRQFGERLMATMAVCDRSTQSAKIARVRPRILLGVLLAVSGFGLVADQAGKSWAFASSGESADLREIAPGIIAGAQGRNYGAMFSAEGDESSAVSRILLTIVGFAGVGMLIRAAVLDHTRWRAIHAVAGGLVLAGALGNQIDRLVLGYVRDYLVLRIHPQGIFNTADVFMALGVLLLVVTWTARRRPASLCLQGGLSQ
jgi:signal peptidase II